MPIPENTLFAAIDIGSNSFRLEFARYELGQLVFAGYHKEMVRLGGGLTADSELTPAVMATGLACLQRFSEHLRGMPPDCVIAVATQALREATNREFFLQSATKTLGFPLRTISGREEARLIYNGVSRLLPQNQESRLVVDIGGRSTEVIVGQGFTAERSESMAIGSVNLSLLHFSEGKFSSKHIKRAISHAVGILEHGLMVTQDFSWEHAYGASGTIGAIADILIATGMSDGSITIEHLHTLLEHLLKAGSPEKLRLEGLRDDRRPVLAGGLCALMAVFQVFNINVLNPAKGALRHGLLYDLLSIHHAKYPDHRDSFTNNTINLREQTVRRLQQRYRVDVVQAQRVHDLVLSWADELGMSSASLDYSAQLHEIGTIVSHVDYHKHGAYLIDRCDVLGFSSGELKKITALILGQCGGLRKMESYWQDTSFMRKMLFLRLAVIFCSARKDPPKHPLRLIPLKQGQGLSLHVNGDWMNDMPHTLYRLQEEVAQWKKTPFSLELVLSKPILD